MSRSYEKPAFFKTSCKSIFSTAFANKLCMQVFYITNGIFLE